MPPIKPRQVKIGVCGPLVPLHTTSIARAIDAEIFQIDQGNIDVDVVLFPFPYPRMKDYVERLKKRGIYTVAYWLGNDVIRIRMDMFYKRDMPSFDLHLGCHQRLVDDLDDLDIKADLLRFFTPFGVHPNEDHRPIRKKMVGVYMPTTGGKYNFENLIKIAEACPDIPFAFYGKGKLDLPRNCKDFGKLDPREASELMNEISLLLRLTIHDGFPQNIIDAKMRGRNVLSSWPYEGCQFVSKLDETIEAVKDEKNHELDTTEWPQWYRKECADWKFDFTLRDILGKHANLSR